jgi:carbon storage regulator CsrA
MLVLSRKLGESVRIGRDVTVTFLGLRGRAMKLGIDAPPRVRILRGELCGGDDPVKPVDDGSRCAPPLPLRLTSDLQPQ